MQKLPYLLLTLTFLTSCFHVTTRNEQPSATSQAAAMEIETTTIPTAQHNEAVIVDKENNAIKINPKLNESSNKNTTSNQSKKVRPLFDWPVWEARMSRGFLPRGSKKRRRPHKGIDLAAPRGSAVMASHDGIVIYTGAAFKGYGKMIMIESLDPVDGSNWATLYGHLDKILVYEGKRVRQGEVIGALGNTGRSSGPHLHFEIRRLDGPIDPLPLLPAGKALTNDVDNGAIEE